MVVSVGGKGGVDIPNGLFGVRLGCSLLKDRFMEDLFSQVQFSPVFCPQNAQLWTETGLGPTQILREPTKPPRTGLLQSMELIQTDLDRFFWV
ncbi:uncharacterized protein LACBIDRAFT_306443 [Laccaria bicolor S238N-H82]|uniref:Predicted protein n=1 Tax=Laccaria bicolor (strain S238N-H82 / ATCC MYA-4686) TaxID=486041 RepID=B0DMY2_LACBS|nr:uncharacterized protein LACBIDRAFT_306443 [Laccaria bicolor S238N-H82]EDR04054.1 predicted protein [Laccaria bicolor S238N-H82]|eukprot:XP_001885309.1 predicted protein [Laccaria bicolor S238N-H82]